MTPSNIIELKVKPYVPRIVNEEPCAVIILPTVRIERFPTDPRERRRRRQVSRDVCGND